ncbi:MAG: hypothetical protein AAF617_06865 [Bacteroidota bacterium]
MLKQIKDIKGLKKLSKKEQKQVRGGDTLLCIALCGPGDGNISIYDYMPPGTPLGDAMIPIEVGCFCV